MKDWNSIRKTVAKLIKGYGDASRIANKVGCTYLQVYRWIITDTSKPVSPDIVLRFEAMAKRKSID